MSRITAFELEFPEENTTQALLFYWNTQIVVWTVLVLNMIFSTYYFFLNC